MNQIRLSELLPGKALKWPEFFVRNIPNIRLESRVIPESQCFRYLHKKGILKVFTTVNQRVLGSSREYLYGSIKKIYQGHLQTQKDAQSQRLLKEIE